MTVNDVTREEIYVCPVCLFQYSPMCTSLLLFYLDWDFDATTQESIMCMLEMPVLLQCTYEMY